jgi:hypothetical protein
MGISPFSGGEIILDPIITTKIGAAIAFSIICVKVAILS